MLTDQIEMKPRSNNERARKGTGLFCENCATRIARYGSEEAEIDFNRRNRCYWRPIGTDRWLEAPGTHGFDCLFVQSEACALHHLDVGRMAVWLYDHLQDHNALELGFACVFRILRLRAIHTARVTHSACSRTESAAAGAATGARA